MYQICCITAAAKKALREKSAILYKPLKYENKIEFQFLPENKLLGTKKYKSENVSAWYDYCLKKGLYDLKFLTPVSVNDRGILGFSNTTQSSIVCFYRNGDFTYFSAQWEFDSNKKMWNVLYTENECKDSSLGKLNFEDNTDSFKAILFEIKEFAYKINRDEFAAIFQKAIDILIGHSNYANTANYMMFPEIPKENLRLFDAASTADVFGAMGSWNDTPRYIAHQINMDKEYEFLSNELLKQVRLATLYAINEW